MKANAKLKDEARKHEQKEEWEKAIEAYVQVVRITEGGGDMETELPLYNRIGDLFVRLGRPIDAVTYYERAADHYADAGLYNNAIALCNKALRYLPSRMELLRKLGQFSAAQGFITDARRWYLEYAERQLKQGALEDAFKALEDFAQVHEDAEIRELLGRHLYAHGRAVQAVAALNRARELRLQAGEVDAAARLAEEIKSIDPSAQVQGAAAQHVAAQAPPPVAAQAPVATPVIPEPPITAPAPPPAAAVIEQEEVVEEQEVIEEEEVIEEVEGIEQEEVVAEVEVSEAPAPPPPAEPTPLPPPEEWSVERVPTASEPIAAALPGLITEERASDFELPEETASDELPTYEEDTVEPAQQVYSGFDAPPDDSTAPFEGGLIDLDAFPDLSLSFDLTTTGLNLLGDDSPLLSAEEVADLPFLQGVTEPVPGAPPREPPRVVQHHEFEFNNADFEYDAPEPLPFLETGQPAQAAAAAAEPEPEVEEPFAEEPQAEAVAEQAGETVVEEIAYEEPEEPTATELETEETDSLAGAFIEVEEIGEPDTNHYEAEAYETSTAAPEADAVEEEFSEADEIVEADDAEVQYEVESVADEPTSFPPVEQERPTFEMVDASDVAEEVAAAVSEEVVEEIEPEPFEAEAIEQEDVEVEAFEAEAFEAEAFAAEPEETEPEEERPHHEPIRGWVPPEPPPSMEVPAVAAPQPAAFDGTREFAHINELIAAGDTMTAMRELEELHPRLAEVGLMHEAWQAAEALMQLEPNNLRVLQQRLEYAATSGDYELCLRSYLDLGRYLRRTGAEAKARVIFQRVLDLDPENAEARAFTRAAEPPKVKTGYVDLLSLISEEDGKLETTRFQVAEKPPTGDEERDFADMLSQFKQKVAENVSMSDSTAHYDLGLAFKDMGLIDEAIAEFQVALKGGEERLKVYEELGQCFLLKQQYNVAVTILKRASALPVRDDADLLGVYYALGRAHEELGQSTEARAAYERVVGFDIKFRDAAKRLGKL